MKIKNYTSAIPVERIISYIESELVKIGIAHIEKTYKDNLPANLEASFEIIKNIPEYKSKNKEWLRSQSNRTAWKLVFDWIQIQIAMIQLKQVEALQVFLPYVYDAVSNKTFYEKIVASNYKLLGE